MKEVYHARNCWRNHHSSYFVINLLILVSLYTLNEIYLKSLHPIFRNHFNDLLAMPLLLSYSSILIKKKLTYPFIISMTIICSFVWEFVTPIFKNNSTGDWMDVVAYVVGSLLWVIERRKYANQWNLRTCKRN